MNSYDRKIKTNFHGYKMLKEVFHCIYLLVMSIYSVFRTVKACDLQVFLENVNLLLKKDGLIYY